MNLGFLNNLNITTIEAAKPAVTKKESNPDPSSLCIRVWKSGEIFPSERLVRDYNLEYPNAIQVENIALFNEDGTPKMVAVEGKEAVQATKRKVTFDETIVANGLDVFPLHSWTQIPESDRMASPNLILVAVTPKSAPKVELFANVKYLEDGKPASSVLTQGASTYGKAVLLPLLKELYNAEPNEEGFIDLQIATEYDQSSKVPNGVFILPKNVTRGTEKGKASYEMRSCSGIFPLVPVAVAAEQNATPVQETVIEDVQPSTVLAAN